MRVAVLCNDRLGIPALQQLLHNNMVQAVGTSDRAPEMIAVMQQITVQSGIPSQVFTRKNFEAELVKWLELHCPDVVLVKTFPFRIPASALTIPVHGFINFHYAPLPQFRGSNPLFWMIREGITTGGVAVHRMDERFDTGPLLLQRAVPVSPEASFGMCVTQLAFAGMEMTIEVLQGLYAGNLKETPQEQKQDRWYGRPKATDFFISWITMNSSQVKALVKACNPWQKGAFVRLKGLTIAITDISLSEIAVPPGTLPGTILHLSPEKGLIIACKDEVALKAEVFFAEEGFFAGERLALFGIRQGDRFE
ncbi:MAG: hypothetical protein M3R17_06430 [Bacteroidota bacterium]|nr:hypothetical protein [Bacteroidota bacterium]